MLDQVSRGRARAKAKAPGGNGKARPGGPRTGKAPAGRTKFDPITIEIIQSALQAVSDEMFAAMRKTAMSAIIYEVLDMGTGLTDASGELTSSGQGIPAFVGVLDKAVKFILKKHAGANAIEPGDVFMTNDPYYGGVTHLNDVVVAMPVFAGKEIVAWTAVIAHWNDVGGMVPGSMSTDAIEIYQEGIRLPAVKLISRGEPIGARIVGPLVSGLSKCAGRGAVKVTTASARAIIPGCGPMTSASAPDGMSTAITAQWLAFIIAIASA